MKIISPTTQRITIHYGSPFNSFILLLFVYLLIKFLSTSGLNTANIRTWVQYSSGYLWVFLFPFFIDTHKKLRSIILIGIAFVVYIFCMQMYLIFLYGYRLHQIGGQLVSLLGTLFFVLRLNHDYLRIKPIFANFVLGLILLNILLIGHRSAFIALMLGMVVLLYYQGIKKNMKFVVFMGVFLIFALLAVTVFYPSVISKAFDRALTTFDFQQTTYQGRWRSIPKILRLSKRYPFMGIPFGKHDTTAIEDVETEFGGITLTGKEVVITPHNLILEWLYLFGVLGLCCGILILLTCLKVIFQFLKKYRAREQIFNWGISAFCAWVFTLFYSLCNVTTASPYTVFFLYFPVVLLISVNRIIEESNLTTDQTA